MADTLSAQPLSIPAIIEQAKSLNLNTAVSLIDGDYEAHCSLPLIHSVLSDGQPLQLSRVNGKHAAIYVRVSSEKQKEDGWSVADQLRRNVSHCIRQGWAFRIYNDQTLSGATAWKSPYLQQKMARDRAQRYKQVFEKIFLDDASTLSVSASERQGMITFLEQKVKKIQTNLNDFSDEATLDEAVDEAALAEPDLDEPDCSGGRKRHTKVRPALTLMISELSEIHTVVVTDASRLCRSTTLFGELGELLQKHRTLVQGTIETLDYMNEASLASGLQGSIFSYFSQMKLQEITTNVMRGVAQMLMEGKFHGQPPFWIRRGADERGELIPERVEAVHRMIELVMAEPKLGYRQIAHRLEQEGFAPPRAGKRWNYSTIKKFLININLIGKQDIFGREWSVLPPVVSEYDFFRIQERIRERGDMPRKKGTFSRGYMMTGLLRCRCGTLVRFTTGGGVKVYLCQPDKIIREKWRGTRHLRFLQSDLDRFFSDLMRSYGRNLVRRMEDDPTRKRLLAEIAALEEKLRHLRRGREGKELQAAEKAAALLAGLGLSETDPQYESQFRSFKMNCLSVLCKDELPVEQSLHTKRGDLERLDKVDRTLTMPQRIERWDGLPDRERNEILRQIIREITLVETKEGESLEVRLNMAQNDAMPLIPLRLEWRGNLLRRRLPTIQEYLRAAYDILPV